MNKPRYSELVDRIKELEQRTLQQEKVEAELLENEHILKEQNRNLVKKSIELSGIKREFEDKNYELESFRNELDKQNVNLIKKSIELSFAMRQIEDKNYDLENILEELRESEQRFKNFANMLPEVVFEVDNTGTFTFVNHGALELFGYTQKDIGKGLNVFQTYIPEDHDKLVEFQERIVNNGKTESIELTALKKDRSTFPILVYSNSVIKDDQLVGSRGFAIDMTEQKKAEGALRESEEKYRSLAENINVGIYRTTCELNGKIIEANPALVEMLGFSNKEELLEVNISDLYQESNNRESFINKILQKDSVYSDEIYLKRNDGSVLICSDSAVLVKDNITGEKYFDGILEDITERKQAEVTLREKQQLNELLLDSLPHATMLINRKKVVVAANKLAMDTGARIGDYCWKEFAGSKGLSEENMKLAQKGPNIKGIKCTFCLAEQCLKDKKPTKVSDVFVFDRYWEIHWIPIDKDLFLHFSIDITDRKRTSNVISALYEISNAVNTSPDLGTLYPIIHNSLSTIIDTTNFYIALYDHGKDTIRFDYSVDENDDAPEIINARTSGSLTAEVINKQCSMLLNKEQLIERHAIGDPDILGTLAETWLGIPLKIKDTAIGVLAVQSYTNPDLYTEKDIEMLESVSEQIALAIETKRIERVGKKLEEQLFHAQKMESIGRLAGGIAHDLNNKIAVILGHAELMPYRNSLVSTEDKSVNAIIKTSIGARDLISQLLGFARQGKYTLTVLNINKLIVEIMNVSEKVFEKKINISYRFENNIKPVEADKSQLDQVLSNLIINARDAMPDGGELSIRTENVFIPEDSDNRTVDLEPGRYVKVSVSDSGIGIPANIKDQIFEPFFTTKGVGEGTGLGLSMVYGILRNHGGAIEVESEQGIGSTFTLLLPESKEEFPEKERTKEIIKGEGKILVVDDDEQVKDVIGMQLDSLGFECLFASDGYEAVEKYSEFYEDIDLVVLDLLMPNMNGEAALQKLKKINPDVKVLIMSGYSHDYRNNKELEKDIVGFVEKPVEMADLSKILSGIFEKKI